jgi:dCTP deaminase
VPHPGEDLRDTVFPFQLELSPDPTTGFSGFVAKKGEPPSPIDPDKKGYYSAPDFWEGVKATDGAIYLEPNRLYILRSRERLRLPGHIALECQAYTETMGEWRIEYAGFAHPYFGWTRTEGSPLMFEVRGHNIPTILTDGIPLGNVCFRRMSKPAEQEKKSQYEKQELKLSGCFKEWSS